MSFTAVGDLTIYGNATTAGTYTFTGAAIPAGSLVVIGWDGNVDSLTVTASDNSTQPGDPNVWFSAGTMSGGTFTAGVHYCLRITRPLLTTDTLTLTLGGSVTASRRSAFGSIYTPGNGNAQLDKYQSVANDTTSPVGPTASTGTLSTASDLAITFGFVKNGAVATGSANTSTNMGSPGLHSEANSGGTVTIVATRMADANLGTTTAMTGSWTYTGITVGACAIMAFSDVLQVWSPDTGRDRASSSDNPENYAPPPSQTMGIFSGNGAAAPDATAFVAASRSNGFGRGAYSAVSNAADEPIPSASGLFQTVQRARPPAPYAPRSFFMPVWDQPAAAPDAYPLGTFKRQTFFYVAPRSLTMIAAAPDTYAPTVSRRQNGQAAAISRSGAIPAYDNSPAVAPDSWAQVLSSRMPARNGSPRSLVIPAYAVAAAPDAWAQVIASRAPPRTNGRYSTAISAYFSAAAAPDVWVQGLASRIVVPYAGSFSAFMGAADEAIAAGGDWASVVTGRPTSSYRGSWSRVIVSADELFPDNYVALIASRPVGFYRGSYSAFSGAADEPLVAGGSEYAALTQSRPSARYLGSWSRVFVSADELPSDAIASVVQGRRVPFYRPPSASFAVLAAAGFVVPDSYVSVTQSKQRKLLLAPSSTTILPSVIPDAYVPLARSSGSLEQVARRSLTIVPREVPVVITQAHVAPAQSRTVANYKAPLSRAITGLNPSPEDEVVNHGGGGEWVIWGKPDFPGNRPGAWPRFPRPGFKRPSRYEKRGY